MKEIETDGFITREEDLMKSKTLEQIEKTKVYTADRTATPMKGCCYPRCENCHDYVDGYCTVPMVITKQIYLATADEMQKMINDIAELKKLVYDEILGEDIDHKGYHKQVVCGEELWCPDGCHIEVHDGLKYYVADEEDK